MPIYFNTLLTDAGLILGDVRLLRHRDRSAQKGRTPYELWRDNRDAFDLYQSLQSPDARSLFGNASHWVSFGVNAAGETVFLGIYTVQFKGMLDRNVPNHIRRVLIWLGVPTSMP